MISVLLPTRKRPEGLRVAIRSVLDLAHSPDDVEIILRVDDNDPTDYSSYGHVLRGPRWGYKHLYKYYDELSAASRGPLLLLWNDDLVMLTKHWDSRLKEYEQRLCVQFMKRDIYAPKIEDDSYQNIDTAYPVYPKLLFEVMGHVSLNCHCDSWLDYVSEACGVKVLRHDIVVHHDRPEDETAAERVFDWEAFHTSDNTSCRANDIEKVRTYLSLHPELRP